MPIVVTNAVTDGRSINHAFGHTNDASIHITDKSTVVHTFFNPDFCTHRVAKHGTNRESLDHSNIFTK